MLWGISTGSKIQCLSFIAEMLFGACGGTTHGSSFSFSPNFLFVWYLRLNLYIEIYYLQKLISIIFKCVGKA